jgi:hypothetical protein
MLMSLWRTMTAKYYILISWLCSQGTGIWSPDYAPKVLDSDIPTMWPMYCILMSRLSDHVLDSDIPTSSLICSWSVCDPQGHWCTTAWYTDSHRFLGHQLVTDMDWWAVENGSGVVDVLLRVQVEWDVWSKWWERRATRWTSSCGMKWD